MSTTGIVDLDDDRAADPAVAGAKAASLSATRAAGLPVLPGFVVVIGAGSAAIEAGSRVLAEGGSGAARLFISGRGLDDALASEVVAAGRRLGSRLVVRSSTLGEAEAAWAGAFASYGETAPEELPRAVSGCWASVFTEDALGRARATGVAPGATKMAVLVQPELRPRHGGSASAGDDGTVTVVGTPGHPAAIASGHVAGDTVVVGGDDGVEAVGGQRLSGALVSEVASLARAVRSETGHDLIEWAEDDDGVWLLQARNAVAPAAASAPRPPVATDPRLAAVAGLLALHPGPVGEALVLPWALGLARLPAPETPAPGLDPQRLWERARRAASRLVAQRWDDPSEPQRVLASLRGPDPGATLDRISASAPPDQRLAADVLGALDRLAVVLAERGAITKPSTLRHLPLGAIERLVSRGHESTEASARFGVGRWEPFLYGSVAALGTSVEGDAVVAGTGAGVLRLVGDADDASRFGPREIVVAVYPVNNLAPLLWEAAAIVTVAGGRGAHLFEVAASLGVPAVCGADVAAAFGAPLEDIDAAIRLGAVDGTTGTVSVLTAASAP